MKTIAQREAAVSQHPADGTKQALQVFLPKTLARRAKAAAAENGIPLRELVEKALEQYLGMGKAA